MSRAAKQQETPGERTEHRKINAKCSGSKNCKAEKQGSKRVAGSKIEWARPRKEDNIVAVAEMLTVVRDR